MISLGLYAVAGLFWVPVVFMQIEMRDLARKARSKTESCRRAIPHFSTAGFCLGFPGLARPWLFSGW
ncbi:hypothetical protein LMTR3_00100 [Bradyrhizobium sp. LMTR 3]|nr:hypothetical protein LMTR3_00100 [Bradyrhizobium sp. LMTR 3]